MRRERPGPLFEAGLEELNVWALAAVQVAQAILIAPILNSVATFGEGFGWRG